MSQLHIQSYVAGEDLSSSKGRGVFISTAPRTVSECDAGGNDAICIGILQNDPESGEVALVAVPGATNVYAQVKGDGTAVAVGDKLKADTGNSGKLIKTTTDTDTVIAVANEASSADGDLIRVDVVKFMVAG